MGNPKQVAEQNLSESDSLYLLVGSYASASEEGIKLFSFDSETGEGRYVSGFFGISNPSYLTVSSDGTRVYAVSENDITDSSINALALDYAGRTFSLLNSCSTQGAAPCYVAISPNEDFVLTANYIGGNVSVFQCKENGELEPHRIIRFLGSGIDTVRQASPHLHCISFTPDNKYVLAVDLGTDRIHAFFINHQSKMESVPFIDEDNSMDLLLPPGCGPRHICFSPNKKYGYLITELSGDVIVLEYLEKQTQIVQVIQADPLKAGGSADIHLSPDGKFLYASNRLKGDGIAIFKVSEKDGTLEGAGYQYTGTHPRNFVISPDGDYLLVACRDADLIQVFRRDKQTGLLTDTGRKIQMSKPSCLKFIVKK